VNVPTQPLTAAPKTISAAFAMVNAARRLLYTAAEALDSITGDYSDASNSIGEIANDLQDVVSNRRGRTCTFPTGGPISSRRSRLPSNYRLGSICSTDRCCARLRYPPESAPGTVVHLLNGEKRLRRKDATAPSGPGNVAIKGTRGPHLGSTPFLGIVVETEEYLPCHLTHFLLMHWRSRRQP
jgi:hypothetical protein